MRSGVAALVLAGGLAVASCGGDESTETTPFHAVPADAVMVSGTATCVVSKAGVDAEGRDNSLLLECELDMSDPRVSGSERHDRFRFVAGTPGVGTVWLAEEATITNADGAWHGSVQAAESSDFVPCGEAHYVGDGSYEGLEFHYFFCQPDATPQSELRGWISGGESS